MLGKISGKHLLVLCGVLAVVVGSTSQALAGRNGLYWYLNQTTVTVTLVNLTDYTLSLPADPDQSRLGVGGANCLSYPFQHGVTVEPYSTAIWKTSNASNVTWYYGKITFLPTGMDPKWSFDLKFSHVYISYWKQYGTWIYLNATCAPDNSCDTSTYGWFPGWVVPDVDAQDLFPYWGRYTTPLEDTHMHNQMNLLGYEVSVSVFSGNNNDITVVIQQTGADYLNGQTPDPYVGWELNWVDNDGNDFP